MRALAERNLGCEMGSALVWLSLALSLALCAGQDAGATKEDIPEGASTLAFVFDVTGSMYDDLVQVIEGASKILETSLSRPKRPLYNFALVPFHDPGNVKHQCGRGSAHFMFYGEFTLCCGDKRTQKSEKCDSLLTVLPLTPPEERLWEILSPCTDVQPGGHYH